MKRILVIPFLFACLLTATLGQQKSNDKTKLVQLPLEFGVVSIVYQPDCPVKIEEAQLFVKPDGSSWDIRYIIRNKSLKGIRYLSYGFLHKSKVVGWGRYGFGFEQTIGQDDGKGEIFLPPNDYFDEIKQDKFEIVPMTKEVKDLFTNKFGNIEMKTFWVGMVTKVIFEDGTVFDAKKLYSNLEDNISDF